eukprot:TRINITY_DN36153_c0_g1_i1.p1 TRINITY_DN36153_c0_g1~~TRINITY_DN36153_c0_g1_i1.p1  ORF type:complete len:590 (+),score=165.58 TRINITY_DN36153_c0_g1_i1:93-1772(+)
MAAAEADAGAAAAAAKCRQEGNMLLQKGEFGKACQQYDKGLAALADCADDPEVRSERLALHLNACLGNLKRGNLATAVDHGSEALAIEPQSVKALYRRGMARARLAEQPDHQEELELAKEDLVAALKLEPKNADVREQLLKLKEALKAGEREQAKTQKSTFQSMFSSSKALYEEPKPAPKMPAVRSSDGGEAKKLLLAAEDVHFGYERGEPVLQGASLDLRAGWCVGLFGNNASGKTTLARLMCRLLEPSAGVVRDHSLPPEASSGRSSVSVFDTSVAVFAVVVGAAAVVLGQERLRGRLLRLRLEAQLLLCCLVLAVSLGIVWTVVTLRRMAQRRAQRRQGLRVVHISCDLQDKEDLPGSKTIERLIAEGMASTLSSEERRRYVIALLRAAGFQMFDQETGQPVGSPEDYVREGLCYGGLSGGQKHLIYVLRCFAQRPDVIIGDELLGGLDAWKQPRVLHMLRRIKEEGTAILYISTELHQVKIVADGLGYLSEGTVVEYGAADDVLTVPKHPTTKEYVSAFRSLPGCSVLGGKLGESYGAIAGDADLKADWLPPRGK